MPKKKAKKTRQAKTDKLIVVHSRAYGEHTRAARGSIKPANLNAALAAKGKQLATINALASEVHNLLKLHAGFFKESMFWQKMLSRMHAAPAITPVVLLGCLPGLELNGRYPLQRFGSLPQIINIKQNSCMNVQLKNDSIPHFNGKGAIYRYDIIVLFFNAKGKATGNVVLNTKWFAINETASITLFNVGVPKNSKLYVMCLRLHAGRKNEPINELRSQGMRLEGRKLVMIARCRFAIFCFTF